MTDINSFFEDLETPYYMRRILDGLSLIVGEPLAYGQYRKVFQYLPDPFKYVIKYEGREAPRCNILEWTIWADMEYTKHGRYLAPCYLLSDDGRWMVQRRIFLPDAYPKKIPRIFNFDTKKENWGMLLPENRFVCCDYANSILFKHEKNLNLEPAKWWDLQRGTTGDRKGEK